VPRTVNAALQQVRRDAFLDAGQKLIQAKGYEAMTIQDVLDELEASRGAFYHYFDSKQALLEAVVDRFADTAMTTLQPIIDDPSLPALRKLEQIFGGIAAFKAERKELVLAIMDVWTSDSNAIVREKLRRMTVRLLNPLLTGVIRQGIREDVIKAGSPEDLATVLVSLMQGFQELALQYFMARQAGTITFEFVLDKFSAYTDAFESILGIEKGSLKLIDEPTLRFWFG
jgi:AcrR family transcriptional regulator